MWEFQVREDSLSEFEGVYGAAGEWAALFRKYPGYEGTTLLQDRGSRTRFLTVDHWKDMASFQEMRRRSQEDYARLDRECGELTVSERELGVFECR